MSILGTHLYQCTNWHCCERLRSASVNFFKDFIYLFLERGREEEREGENHQCVVASHTATGDPLVHKPSFNPLSHNSQVNFFKDFFNVFAHFMMGDL